MKIHVEIDVSPLEVRELFGLPEVQELQRELLDQVRAQMETGAEGFDPVSLLKPLIPAHMQGWEALQKAFRAGITEATKKRED